MPKTKDGGFLLHEPEAAAGPYIVPKAKGKGTKKKSSPVKKTDAGKVKKK